MNSDPHEFIHQNRRAWNEIAEVRSKTSPSAAFFAGGGCTLSKRIVEAAQLPPPQSRPSVIHLQCATGEDTLSWAGLGADAYGVDISELQVGIANQKARDAGRAARFAAADVYQLPGALPADWPAQYDRVFTGGGALCWLPDIARWAQIVAGLLKSGGRLVLEDIHPVSAILWEVDGRIEFVGVYFSRGQGEASTGWTHFKGGEDAQEVRYEFAWPLGDIVTALARAGLVIERLEEFPGGPAYRFHEKLEDSMRLPCDFLLTAHK